MYRDILTFGGMLSKGSESYFASYEIPEPLLKTRIGVGFDYSTTEIISGPLHPLNVDGHFYDYYIYVKKPFWVTETMISNFNLSFSAKNGANYVDSYRTQTTKTDLITLAFDNIWIFNGGYLFNLLSAGQGVKALEGKNEFTKFNYSGEFQTAVWGPLAFNLKAKAQLKAGGHDLPSSEQFQLGGVNTVRGYTEGMLIGDKGFDVMSELQFDFTSTLPRFVTYAKLFGFFDYGRIYPSKDTITPEGYDKDIYSAGGIYNVLEEEGVNIKGGNLTLEASEGAIGSGEKALSADISGKLNARALDGVWLSSPGNLAVDYIFTEGLADIKTAGAVADARGDDLPNIRAYGINIEAAEAGSEEQALGVALEQGGRH